MAPRGGGGAVAPRGAVASSRTGVPVGHAVPRPGYGYGYRGHPYGHYGGTHVYVGYPYWGWYGYGWGAWGYAGWYGGMWWPYWGWWGWPGPYYAAPYGIVSDARLLVKPRNTEVYVDGALAGIVDSYDGAFQSLHLSPGTHEITLYLDGHRRYSQNVYVAPGATLKVRHTMEPLAAGSPPDERPTPPPRQERPARYAADPDQAPPPSAPSTEVAPRAERTPMVPSDSALLVIRVQPADAEVWIDGQRWQTPSPDRPLEVRVPPGRIRLEIRRPGYDPFTTEVVVEPGVVTPVNVSLPTRRGAQL